METQTKYLKDAWYKLEYQRDEYSISFKAWKIQELYEDEIEKSTIENEYSIYGYLKWDGCMEFEQKEHYCGVYAAEQTLLLIKEIYKIVESSL